MYKILMTDSGDPLWCDVMTINGLPKLFTDLDAANTFCESLNRVARDENQTWRYEAARLSSNEENEIRALAFKFGSVI